MFVPSHLLNGLIKILFLCCSTMIELWTASNFLCKVMNSRRKILLDGKDICDKSAAHSKCFKVWMKVENLNNDLENKNDAALDLPEFPYSLNSSTSNLFSTFICFLLVLDITN